MIGIVDIDMGNLRSVTNAVSAVGHDPRVVREPGDFGDVSHVVLPGVGAYATAMSHLERQGLVEPIRAFAASGRPVLGICLGMQLLSASGDEGGPRDGLALIQGHVVRFDSSLVPAVPHIGWNELRLRKAHPLFQRVKRGADFYFVHSYHFACDRDEHAAGVVEYGDNDYVAFVARDNVVGLQFHPEKSQANGLKVLENFCDWDGRC